MDLKIGSVYSFNTRAPSVLGSRVEQVKLKAVLSAEVARQFDAIDQKYAQVLPQLPSGTPTSPNDTQFYLFEAANGSSVAFSEVWIQESTIEEIELVTITVTVPRATLSDVSRVRVAMSSLQDLQFSISTRT